MSGICGDTVGNCLRGYPCFLLAGDMLGNAPSGSPLLFGHFPKCIHSSVKVAEKVSNTLWAFPNKSPIPFNYFSTQRGIIWAFPLHFPRSSAFCLLRWEIKDSTEKYKNHQRFLYCLFSIQSYHFYPSSNWCNSPFTKDLGNGYSACSFPYCSIIGPDLYSVHIIHKVVRGNSQNNISLGLYFYTIL